MKTAFVSLFLISFSSFLQAQIVISKDSASIKNAEKIIYVLDGKKISKSNMPAPENIERIDVLKGEKAIKKYGADAASGVIEIISKKRKTIAGTSEENSIVYEMTPALCGYKKDLKAFFKANYKPLQNDAGAELHGAITVQFILDTEGRLDKFKMVSIEMTHDLNAQQIFDEVVRVLKLTQPQDWEPAVQGGHRVKVWHQERFEF